MSVSPAEEFLEEILPYLEILDAQIGVHWLPPTTLSICIRLFSFSRGVTSPAPLPGSGTGGNQLTTDLCVWYFRFTRRPAKSDRLVYWVQVNSWERLRGSTIRRPALGTTQPYRHSDLTALVPG